MCIGVWRCNEALFIHASISGWDVASGCVLSFEMEYIVQNDSWCRPYATYSLPSSRLLCHSTLSSLHPVFSVFIAGDLVLEHREDLDR